MWRRMVSFSLIVAVAGGCGCGRGSSQPVESLGGGGDVSGFALKSLRGTRDGESLQVQASYGAPNSQEAARLIVDLRFDVKPPARLTSGTWKGLGGEGSVVQKSVTFLGGQSSAASIGGRFELVGVPDQRALYRVTIPLQELKNPIQFR